MKKCALIICAALAAATLSAVQPGTATLTVSGYTGTENLTDFPVLVRVPAAIILACGADGSAMRFYAADGVTELAHQIDTWRYGYEPSGTCEAITDLVAAKGAGFVDAANGDWRLQRRSPLRDAGVRLDWMTDGATDLDRHPRLTDRFGKSFAPGALPDIGCYECQIHTPHGTTIMVK